VVPERATMKRNGQAGKEERGGGGGEGRKGLSLMAIRFCFMAIEFSFCTSRCSQSATFLCKRKLSAHLLCHEHNKLSFTISKVYGLGNQLKEEYPKLFWITKIALELVTRHNLMFWKFESHPE